MITCPNCGEKNRNNDRYCLTCGTSLKKQIDELNKKKELEEIKRLQEEQNKKQTQKEQETYRDFNRRNTRKTSKNIKNINQGKIQKQRMKKGIKNVFQTEFHPLPIILSALLPGLGFTYYNKWKKAFFFMIISILFVIYLFPTHEGKLIYIVYWVLVLFLTHIQS